MSQFETKCPNCGTALSVQDEWIGMEVECPQCKQQFTIRKEPVRSGPAAPAVSISVPTPAQTDNAGTFTFVCPSCNAVAELPNSQLGQQYECQMCFETAVAQATTEKQCPYCGQTVKYHATVCKFCKADLTKAPPSAPKQEETFVFICPECDTVEFLPMSMKGQQYECKKCCETSVAEPAEERKCPHCGEKIKIKAAICKHCKKNVKPLTPSSAGGGASQMLAGLKQRGSQLFGGSSNPQTDPLPESCLSPAGEKTLTKTTLWSLVWPGAGQIYLGQVGKGIAIIAGFTVFLIALGAFGAAVPPSVFKLLRFVIRIVFYIVIGWITGDAFAVLNKLQLGEPVGKWEFITPKTVKKRGELPEDMYRAQKKATILFVICVVLGLTGPGLLSWVAFFMSIMS